MYVSAILAKFKPQPQTRRNEAVCGCIVCVFNIQMFVFFVFVCRRLFLCFMWLWTSNKRSDWLPYRASIIGVGRGGFPGWRCTPPRWVGTVFFQQLEHYACGSERVCLPQRNDICRLCSHETRFLGLLMHSECTSGRVFAPKPHWGSLQRSPDRLAGGDGAHCTLTFPPFPLLGLWPRISALWTL